MEEDSAKRNERLRAMRMEASQVPAPSPLPTPALPLPHLSDAAMLPPPMLPASEGSPTAARFDFYTDPASAFSSAKRRRGGGAAVPSSPSPYRSPTPSFYSGGPRNYNGPHNHHPAQQPHMMQTPLHSSYEMPPHIPQNNAWRSPIPPQSPLPGHETPSRVFQNAQFRSPLSAPFSGHTATPYSPASWSNRSGGSTDYGFPNHSSRGGFTSPQSGRGSVGAYPGNSGSSYFSSGRGRGRSSHFNSSPSRQWNSGGGRGFPRNNFRQQDTEKMLKSIVKDPWRKLSPVVGNILEPLAGRGGKFQPKSSDTKQANTSQSSLKLNSKSSLAEFLAASLEEASEESET